MHPPYAAGGSPATRFPRRAAWRASCRHCCCPVPDIHLGLEALAIRLTGLPVPWVCFIMMVPTERVAGMIVVTTVARKGKEHVGVLVITNPPATALRARQVPGLAA